jgi:hypothetical protein
MDICFSVLGLIALALIVVGTSKEGERGEGKIAVAAFIIVNILWIAAVSGMWRLK